MSDLTWATYYTDRAAAYEVLFLHEDCQGNLPRATQTIQPLVGGLRLNLAAGTAV